MDKKQCYHKIITEEIKKKAELGRKNNWKRRILNKNEELHTSTRPDKDDSAEP